MEQGVVWSKGGSEAREILRGCASCCLAYPSTLLTPSYPPHPITQQSLLSQKTSHLTSVMSQFNKLREDFEYNVKVVEGRDRELKRYEDYVGALERKVEEAAEEVR